MHDIDWPRIAAAATRAPSVHNTQPWRFVAGPDRLDVFYDRERALPVLDPTGRQQVISCGIAVTFAEVALAAAGAATTTELLPGDEADHLARIRVTGPVEPADGERALATSIEQRHTVRAAFEPRAVPAELLDRLERVAGSYGLWFKPITRSEEETATVFLLSRAEEVEQGDPAYLEELKSWLRTDPGAVDGVPVEALPEGDPHQRPSNWLVRDFAVGSREPHRFLPAGDPDAPPPEVERPTVVLLGTESDDRAAWLQAGQALGRVLLQATVEGLVASPLTQALDWPATRTRLRQRLSLVGYPQMLLRMGYPPAGLAAPVSGRRPVAEVLRVESA